MPELLQYTSRQKSCGVLQLADIVRDFIKQSDRIDPHAEERFMYFLQERAGR